MNPYGLPARQNSTARDMARIAFRVYRNHDLREAMAMRIAFAIRVVAWRS